MVNIDSPSTDNREQYNGAYRSLPAKIRLAEARRILDALPEQKVPQWDEVLQDA